ncbi:MAG: restriction endonuclease subunit S [Lachnospiraceae bacterium]|nr:restriction endonuclease subunit S [Lachnospiraceae bacterium]
MADVIYKKFRLGDVFEKLPVNKANKKDLKKYPDSEYCIPVVYAKYGDNGIMYWGRKNDFTTYNNVISIVYNGVISAGKVYAQERETGILAESYFIRVKNVDDIPFEANFFMAIIIEHVIYPKYSRENLATWDNRVENEEIMLPVVENTDNQIDYDYMKKYIGGLMESGYKKLGAFMERIGVKDCTSSPQ